MKTNRFFSLTLLFAILLSTFSCGNEEITVKDESTSSSQTTQSTEYDRLDELGEKDFGGKTFTILDANDHPDMHVNMPGDSINGDIVNDALYERDAYIEERYGVNIEYIQLTNAKNGTTTLKNSILADDDEYTLCISTLLGGTLGTIALDGVLANLSDNDYISLDQNWWSSLMYEHLNLGGKMYYTTGDISPTMYQMPACLFLNTDLADDYGITTDFCQLVRDGKWTLDELIKITKGLNEDVNDDGVMHADDDFFGFANQSINGTLAANFFATTQGIELSTIEGDTIIVDLQNERTYEIIEKLRQIVIPDVKCQEQNDIITKTFKEDRALTMVHYAESASVHLRDMKSDYLVLPVPKYDENQDTYHSFCNAWADAFIAIPVTADQEFAGFITEALGYYSYKYIRPKTYDLTYKQKTSRDENSAEMLDIIFNTLYIDFNCIYNFGGTSNVISNALQGTSELSSGLASIVDKTQADIDSFADSWLG